jgi:hypothetical protein
LTPQFVFIPDVTITETEPQRRRLLQKHTTHVHSKIEKFVFYDPKAANSTSFDQRERSVFFAVGGTDQWLSSKKLEPRFGWWFGKNGTNQKWSRSDGDV